MLCSQMIHLLIRENEKSSITQLVLIQHLVQLLARFLDTLTIVRINLRFGDDTGSQDAHNVQRIWVLGYSGSSASTEDEFCPVLRHPTQWMRCFCTLQSQHWILQGRVDTVGKATKKSIQQNSFSPIVGIVVTISPNFSLYKMVVFPAASRPTMRIRTCFLPKRRLNSPEIVKPMSIEVQSLKNKHDDLKTQQENT